MFYEHVTKGWIKHFWVLSSECITPIDNPQRCPPIVPMTTQPMQLHRIINTACFRPTMSAAIFGISFFPQTKYHWWKLFMSEWKNVLYAMFTENNIYLYTHCLVAKCQPSSCDINADFHCLASWSAG